MKKAILGKAGQSNVSIDIEALLASRLLVTAQSGGGKSWLLRRIAEQTAGQVQQIIIDPEGEFYTLREKHPYIVAGKDGDCPAHPRSAAVLARHLLELQASAILDIYELTPQERKSFVREFLMSMINAPKKLWRPVLIFLDEAHEFAPQKAPSEASAAVAALMTRGRKRGFCGVLATQRISSLDKDAVAQVGNKLIGKATLDLDVKRSLEELGLGKGDATELRRFGPGEFWAYGPAFSITEGIAKIGVGPVETTHPRPGIAVPPVPPAQEEITKALAGLAELDREAEEQERTIEGLEKQVAELKRELRKKEPTGIPEVEVERLKIVARADGFLSGSSEGLKSGISALQDLLDRVAAKTERRAELQKPSEIIPKDIPANVVASPILTQQRIARPSPGLQNGLIKSAAPANGNLGNGADRKILIAAAMYHPEGCPLDRATLMAGYSQRSSTARAVMSKLRKMGLVEEGSGPVRVTQAGIDALGDDYHQLPTGADLRDFWRSELGSPESAARRLFDVIVEEYPRPVAISEACMRLGISPESSTGRAVTSRLNKLGIVKRVGAGQYRASEELF